jgi:hypothetical protein
MGIPEPEHLAQTLKAAPTEQAQQIVRKQLGALGVDDAGHTPEQAAAASRKAAADEKAAARHQPPKGRSAPSRATG